MDIFTIPALQLQRFTLWTWLVLTTTVFAAYAVWAHFSRIRRIRRQGSRAGTVLPHKIPWGDSTKKPYVWGTKLIHLGFDTAFRIFRSVLSHELIEVQQDVLKHGHVVEVNMAGSPMIFTDEPDVFRACMSTKVSVHDWLD